MRLSVLCPYCGGLRCGHCGDTGRVELYLSGLTVMLVALMLVVGFAAGYWWHGSLVAHGQEVIVEAAEPVPPPPCGPVWVVQSGDTPWDIAERCYPGEHTGQRAHEIVSINGVDAGRLREGMVLVLPERGR